MFWVYNFNIKRTISFSKGQTHPILLKSHFYNPERIHPLGESVPENMSCNVGLLFLAFHQMEAFMVKAFRGDAVVYLPRASNNADHESLRLTRRVKYFQNADRSA